MTQASRWRTSVVLAVLLFGAGVARCEDYLTASRRAGCLSNRHSIDKMMGVWESQYVEAPAEASFIIDIHGTVVAQEGLGDLKVPAAGQLKAGSKVLFNYVKDENVMQCPFAVAAAGGAEKLKGLNVAHYRWEQHTAPSAALDGKKRFTRCLWCDPTTNPSAR